MRFQERWRLAGIILAEARFQGFLDSNPMYRTSIKENPKKIIRSIKSNILVNNFLLVFVLLITALSAAASGLFLGPGGDSLLQLTFSFAMFLLFGFAIIFFLNLLSTIGLFSSDLYTLPAIQPLTKQEGTELIMLAFIRMFLWPILILVLVYPIAILFFIGPFAAAVAFVGCLSTASLSIGALIVTSRWFYRKAHSSSQSKGSAALRIIAGLGIAVGMIIAYSMMSLIPVIIEFVSQILSIPGMEYTMFLLGALFPISYGILLTFVSDPLSTPLLLVLISSVASVLYTGLAYVVYRRGGAILKSAIIGGIEVGTTSQEQSVDIRTRGQVGAIILKDLRLASRNLGTTVIFVFPLLMLIALFPMLQFIPALHLRSLNVLVALGYAQGFSGIIIIALLTFDTQGSSILEGLPIGSTKTMQAKVTLFLFIHVMTTVVITFMIYVSNPITPLLLWLPILQIPMGYAMATMTIVGVFRTKGRGRAVAVSLGSDTPTLLLGIVLSGVIGTAPLIVYGVLLVQYGTHIVALLGQGIATLLLCAFSFWSGPRFLKD